MKFNALGPEIDPDLKAVEEADFVLHFGRQMPSGALEFRHAARSVLEACMEVWKERLEREEREKERENMKVRWEEEAARVEAHQMKMKKKVWEQQEMPNPNPNPN